MALHTLQTEDTIADHRRFLMGLNVQEGQMFAHALGGYPVPSVDVQRQELLEVAKTAYALGQHDAMELINNHAWWMLQIMDPGRKMSRHQANRRADELSSFSLSLINALVAKGVLQWTQDVALPEEYSQIRSVRVEETE